MKAGDAALGVEGDNGVQHALSELAGDCDDMIAALDRDESGWDLLEGAFLSKELVPDLAELFGGESGGNLRGGGCYSFVKLAGGKVHDEGAAEGLEVWRRSLQLAGKCGGHAEKNGQ